MREVTKLLALTLLISSCGWTEPSHDPREGAGTGQTQKPGSSPQGETPEDQDILELTGPNILKNRCAGCHGPNGSKAAKRAIPDITNTDALINEDLIRPGQPEKSYLMDEILSDSMPPRRPLPKFEKVIVSEWIKNL